MKEGSTESIQYFYNDHLGSRRAVTDSSGTVQAKLDYSVWGVPTVTNYNGYDGSLDVSYTGKEKDATGLYYFNARYYDSSIGRFITEDPARNGLNWFVYCNNNPLRLVDHTGKLPIVGDDEQGSPIIYFPNTGDAVNTRMGEEVDPNNYEKPSKHNGRMQENRPFLRN